MEHLHNYSSVPRKISYQERERQSCDDEDRNFFSSNYTTRIVFSLLYAKIHAGALLFIVTACRLSTYTSHTKYINKQILDSLPFEKLARQF